MAIPPRVVPAGQQVSGSGYSIEPRQNARADVPGNPSTAMNYQSCVFGRRGPRPAHTVPTKSLTVRRSESNLKMKTIAAPVAELLSQLHDHAAGVVKLIEAIPALRGDDLPQIVNRVHMLGKLKELEAEFPTDKVPADAYLRTRVRLLQAHRQAQDDDFLGYEFRGMSNKQLTTRVELLRKIVADQLNDWTDVEVDEAIAELQRKRRRRKRDAKVAEGEVSKQSTEKEENEESRI